MDTTQLITIVIIVAVVYLLIKFIVSPLLRLISGIILFIAVIYILQTFFKFDFSNILGGWLDIKNIGTKLPWLGWFIDYIGSWINQAILFFKLLLSNTPKT